MKHNITSESVAKSVRKTWGELNPVTKRIESKRQYNRKEKFTKSIDKQD